MTSTFPGTSYIISAKYLDKYLMEYKQEIKYLESRACIRENV